jgi:hypothetical protein
LVADGPRDEVLAMLTHNPTQKEPAKTRSKRAGKDRRIKPFRVLGEESKEEATPAQSAD